MPVRHLLTVLILSLAFAGCDRFPRDAGGTMNRTASGGPLRVGWSASPPWTRATEGSEPAGIEPELIRAWAAIQDAEVVWVSGAEDRLARALEKHEIDILIAGLTADHPWGAGFGTSRPFARVRVSIGAPADAKAPSDWEGVEVGYAQHRPDFAALARKEGAVPGGKATFIVAYDFELRERDMRAVGDPLSTETHVIAVAPGENALALSLDRFIAAREKGR